MSEKIKAHEAIEDNKRSNITSCTTILASRINLKIDNSDIGVSSKDSSITKINQAKEFLGEDLFTQLREASMLKILQNVGTDATQPGLGPVFNGPSFRKALDLYGKDTLQAMFGKDLTKGGKPLNLKDELLALFAGTRIIRIDVKKDLRFKIINCKRFIHSKKLFVIDIGLWKQLFYLILA